MNRATVRLEGNSLALPATKLTKTNVGKQFGKRDLVGKAYLTRQFLKLYGKLIELEHKDKSRKFKYMHLDLEDIKKCNSDIVEEEFGNNTKQLQYRLRKKLQGLTSKVSRIEKENIKNKIISLYNKLGITPT